MNLYCESVCTIPDRISRSFASVVGMSIKQLSPEQQEAKVKDKGAKVKGQRVTDLSQLYLVKLWHK